MASDIPVKITGNNRNAKEHKKLKQPVHYCSFHCFLDLTSSEILQEVLFLVVFLLPLPEEWKHYTTTCENERGIHGAGGLGHGSSEFLLSVVVPISALEG